MKEIRLGKINRTALELWLATALFLIAILQFLGPPLANGDGQGYAPNRGDFEVHGVAFNYYQHFIIPQLVRFCALFGAFAWLNFSVVPAFIQNENRRRQGWYIAAAVAGVFLVNLFTQFYLKQYMVVASAHKGAAFTRLVQEAFLFTFQLLMFFAAYLMVRYTLSWVLVPMLRQRWQTMTVGKERLLLLALGVIVAIFLLSIPAPQLFFLWIFGLPSAVIVYRLSFRSLIPKAYGGKRPFLRYMLRLLPLCLFFLVLTAVVVGNIMDPEEGMGVAVGNAAIQYFVVGPAVWLYFKKQSRGNEELLALKSELGTSAASLDLLRSQINPHFLFNALNTIYGTALQEGAERTAEAAQMLGDMMRFMLQENMQDKIALTRDVAYLQNYISLQQLRTQASPDINIQVDVQPAILPQLQVAPMLLIPFIENAFKHGISLREPSYIRISLEVRDHKLYFDVYNSKHPRPQHDPEQYHGGIGLNNVRQRLQLLYPGRHELVIRENARDFFVHLVLVLEDQPVANAAKG